MLPSCRFESSEYSQAALNFASDCLYHVWHVESLDPAVRSVFPYVSNQLSFLLFAILGVVTRTQHKTSTSRLIGQGMEVHAHAASGRADLATELMRRQWGYMLNCPNSTNSTFWEGYQADGQYAFQGIYMSHAHGWASGLAEKTTPNTSIGVKRSLIAQYGIRTMN